MVFIGIQSLIVQRYALHMAGICVSLHGTTCHCALATVHSTALLVSAGRGPSIAMQCFQILVVGG